MSSYLRPALTITSFEGPHMVADGKVFSVIRDNIPSELPVEHYDNPDHIGQLAFLRDLNWIRPTMPFLLFVPLYHSFHGPIFGRLNVANNRFPLERAGRDGWCLSSGLVEEWMALEHTLRLVVLKMLELAAPSSLSSTFRLWAWPTRYGYSTKKGSRRTMQEVAARSRDAFLPLMGCMSFAFMCMQVKVQVVDWYEWREKLVELTGIHPEWLAELEASDVGDPHLQRVGGIIDAKDWPLDLISLVSHGNMPIYISWGDIDNLELSLSARYSQLEWIPSLKAVANLREMSRPASGSTSNSQPATSNPPMVLPTTMSTITQPPVETWSEFFQRRDAHNAKREKAETSEERKVRKAKEKHAERGLCPGKRGAVIWKWEKEDGIRVRRMAGRRTYEDIWATYGTKQKIYDSWSNCWDICTEFDPDDLDDLYNDFSDEEISSDVRDEGPPTTLLPDNPLPITSNFSTATDLARQHSHDQHDYPLELSTTMSQIAYDRYGFIDGADDTSPTNEIAWDMVRKLLGNGCWLDSGLYSEPDISLATQTCLSRFFGFLFSASTTSSIPSSCHDLQDYESDINNTSFWNFRIRSLSLDGTKFYLFRLANTLKGYDTDIELAVSSAATVLQIIRCQWGPRLEDVALQLISHGIPFNTFWHGSTQSLYSQPSIKHGLGFRPQNYTPDAVDFQAYESLRDDFLRGPKGRAAILAGGIIGRIAREIVRPEDVIYGPSCNVDKDGRCFQAPSQTIGYWDDDLTPDEIDLICGVYYVETGQQDNNDPQRAHMSWWPRPSTFAHAAMEIGFWSKDCERFYQRRLLECRNGKAKLRKSTDWKGLLKQTRAVSRGVQKSESLASIFLESH